MDFKFKRVKQSRLGFWSMKPVLLQDSKIFRIHILLNVYEFCFLEAYRFQNSEGLEDLKEYARKFRT